jgi:hypothetical protein
MSNKRIAILFGGENRLDFLSGKLSDNSIQIKNYNEYLFTNEFKKKYNYDIFISTDNINMENCVNYFGKNKLKNIHLTTLKNDISYLNKIEKNILHFEYYNNIYFNQDTTIYWRYDNHIYYHYRLYDMYNLLYNYDNDLLKNYDYIIYIRIDVFLNTNIINYLDILDKNNNIKIFTQGNIFTIGRPSISEKLLKIITREKYYNKHLNKINYNFNLTNESIVSKEFFYNDDIEHQKRYSLCSELQFIECLFEYCVENNLDIDISIKNLPNICNVYIKDKDNNYEIKKW